MSLRYPILLFDADETLFDFRRSEKEALAATLAAWEVPNPREAAALYHQINEGLWRAFEQGRIPKEEIQAQRFTRLFARLGFEGDGIRCNRDYLEALGRQAFLLPGAEELCRRLKGLGARLYIVTNGISATQKSRLERSALNRWVDGMFVSEDCGAPKPFPRYFQAVFRSLFGAERPPLEKMLLIGDSLASDIQGAKNAGIASCWLNPGGLPSTGPRPDYTIASLEEVVPIVVGGEGSPGGAGG